MTEVDKLRYPIGKNVKPERFTKEILSGYIATITGLPEKLRNEVAHLTHEQLETPYRPDGWTIRQVVHHLADSHMNSFIRFKLTLTEEKPTVKPFIEGKWAELPDGKIMPIEPSLLLLEGLHKRWAFLLNSLSEKDLERRFVHPEHQKEFQLNEIIGNYAWHCDHHFSHIKNLKKVKNWK